MLLQAEIAACKANTTCTDCWTSAPDFLDYGTVKECTQAGVRAAFGSVQYLNTTACVTAAASAGPLSVLLDCSASNQIANSDCGGNKACSTSVRQQTVYKVHDTHASNCTLAIPADLLPACALNTSTVYLSQLNACLDDAICKPCRLPLSVTAVCSAGYNALYNSLRENLSGNCSTNSLLDSNIKCLAQYHVAECGKSTSAATPQLTLTAAAVSVVLALCISLWR